MLVILGSQALLARKAKKAAKEVAAKQAANAPVVSKPQDVIGKWNYLQNYLAKVKY